MNWETIFKHLTTAGFEVCSLGQHKGECTEPYLVLRSNGSTLDQSLELPEYELLLYYPFNRYSRFESYIEAVKSTMNELFPVLRLVDGPSSHYLDDDVNAYMASMIYRTKKINTVNRI